MGKQMQNYDNTFKILETAIMGAVNKIDSLKQINKDLKSEVNELKRLLALSEKKAERLKLELDELKSNGQQNWRVKEKNIKDHLVRLSAKISAFENSQSLGS
jgi:chromosome segregation ATPase